MLRSEERVRQLELHTESADITVDGMASALTNDGRRSARVGDNGTRASRDQSVAGVTAYVWVVSATP